MFFFPGFTISIWEGAKTFIIRETLFRGPKKKILKKKKNEPIADRYVSVESANSAKTDPISILNSLLW